MRTPLRILMAATIGASALMCAGTFARTSPVPDFTGGWGHGVPDQEYENPPEGGPGPTRNIVGQER